MANIVPDKISLSTVVIIFKVLNYTYHFSTNWYYVLFSRFESGESSCKIEIPLHTNDAMWYVFFLKIKGLFYVSNMKCH